MSQENFENNREMIPKWKKPFEKISPPKIVLAAAGICLLVVIVLILCCNQNKQKPSLPFFEKPVQIHERGHIYYLCGWKRQYDNFDDLAGSFQNDFYRMYLSPTLLIEFDAVRWPWRAGGSSEENDSAVYERAAARADADAKGLAQEILNLPPEEQKNVILVGHSLGARVIIRAMAILCDRNVRIRRAVLFGACISSEDADVRKAAKISIEPILNMIHPQDGALMMASFNSGYPQLGTGVMEDIENIREILIASNEMLPFGSDVLDGYSLLEKYRDNHSLPNFLNGWKTYLENGERPFINEFIVPQQYPNVKVQVLGGEFCWNVIESCNGWKVQRNIFSGHCRILDPSNYRYAAGSQSNMRKVFSKIKRQMN